MSSHDSWRTQRGRVAALTRSRAADDPELVAARRRLRELRLTDQIQRLVDQAPPLSAAQCEQIVGILNARVVGAA